MRAIASSRIVPSRTCLSAVAAWGLLFSSAAAQELVQVVAKVENSVVRVNTDVGFGSGVIIEDAGLVLTNFHVIDGARQVDIMLRDGKVTEARGYLAVDPTHDLALLKIDALDQPAAMALAAALPRVGEKVAAFGNPQGFSFTTSEGIVSAIRTGREVTEVIGEPEYRRLGYSAEANWIQTTASISPGNSGGPLVNMNAELVGLNTWSFTDGQSLNFAVSLTDIRRLLGGKFNADEPRSFATLPITRSKIAATPPRSKDFKLTLPTGRVFSTAIFDTRASTLALMRDRRANETVVLEHPNGQVYAAADQQNGVLHGVTLAQYDNQEPMAYVNYRDGRRHGLLKAWNEAGDPVLFSQYFQGRRHGFTCFFEKSELALIGQYKADELEYLQLMAGRQPLEGFASLEAAEKNRKASQLLEKLAAVEEMLKKNEVDFKRQVREFEIAQRRALAGQLSAEKRARIQQRASDRAAANSAFIRELYRRANGR